MHFKIIFFINIGGIPDKEKRIKEIIKKRGNHPGLVHIFSAMETCQSYKPWHDKKNGKAYLKYSTSKCLHYYFYFIDEELGLCYVRVPTWCPFRLQIYFNGHNIPASQLKKRGVDHVLLDNAFLSIADFDLANLLSQNIDINKLHEKLDTFAQTYCPAIKTLDVSYHWSIMQIEYATDIIFKHQKDLQAIYSLLLETLIHSVKPENISTFLGKKLHGNYAGEMGNNFNVRILGSRIKHQMGPVSIKMYDKLGLILRIETVINDVSFFKHYREVQHRGGSCETKYANMRKNFYTLNPLNHSWGKGSSLVFRASMYNLKPVFVVSSNPPKSSIHYRVLSFESLWCGRLVLGCSPPNKGGGNM